MFFETQYCDVVKYKYHNCQYYSCIYLVYVGHFYLLTWVETKLYKRYKLNYIN